MKQTIIFYTCLLSFLLQGQTAFNITIDEDYRNETSEGIIQALDGGFIMTGAYFVSEYKTIVTKFDAYGKVEWNQQFDVDSTLQVGRSIVQLPDSNLVIGIVSDLFPGTSYILKLDNKGNELARWKYGDEQDCFSLNDLIQTSDGFAFTGLYIDYDEEQNFIESDVFIGKVNIDGTLAWLKTYPYPDGNQGKAIEQTPDGGFIVAQSNINPDGYSAALLKVDSFGNKIWQETYTDEAESATGLSSVLVRGNKYVATGVKEKLGYILTVNANGTIYQEREYNLGYDRHNLYYTVLQENNELMIAGSVDNQDGPSVEYDGFLGKFNANNDLIWYQTYTHQPANDQEYIFAMNATNDGGCIMSGMVIDPFPEKNNFWIIKVDSLGNDSLDLSARIESSQSFVYQGESLHLKGVPFGGINCYESHHWTGNGSSFLETTDHKEVVFEGTTLGVYSLIYTVTDSLDNTASDTIEIEVIPFTMLENIDKKEMTIYPNPAKDYLFLDTSLSGEWNMTIYDVNGKILQQDFINSQSKFELRKLQSGIYFYELRAIDSGIVRGKLVIE